MPVRPAFGRPLDRATPQFTSPIIHGNGLVIVAPLYPSRAERATGMAPPFVLRFSVAPW